MLSQNFENHAAHFAIPSQDIAADCNTISYVTWALGAALRDFFGPNAVMGVADHSFRRRLQHVTDTQPERLHTPAAEDSMHQVRRCMAATSLAWRRFCAGQCTHTPECAFPSAGVRGPIPSSQFTCAARVRFLRGRAR